MTASRCSRNGILTVARASPRSVSLTSSSALCQQAIDQSGNREIVHPPTTISPDQCGGSSALNQQQEGRCDRRGATEPYQPALHRPFAAYLQRRVSESPGDELKRRLELIVGEAGDDVWEWTSCLGALLMALGILSSKLKPEASEPRAGQAISRSFGQIKLSTPGRTRRRCPEDYLTRALRSRFTRLRSPRNGARPAR
jgi:hypothetical protein